MLEDGSVLASLCYRILGVDGPRRNRFNHLCRTMLKYRLHIDWSPIFDVCFFCVPRVWISEPQVFCVKNDWWGRDTAKHVLYTVFLAFPKCLAQLQSFAIEMVVYPHSLSDGLLWARLPVAAPVVATTCDSSITLPWSEIWWCKSQDIVYHNPLIKQPILEVTSNSLWRWCNCCHGYYRIISMMPTPSMPGDVSRAFVL